MTTNNNSNSNSNKDSSYLPMDPEGFKSYILQSGLTIENDTGLLVSKNLEQGGGGWPTVNDLKKVLELTPNYNYDKNFDLEFFILKTGKYLIDENKFLVVSPDPLDNGGWPHWIDFAAIQRQIGEHYHPELKQEPLLKAEDLPDGMFGMLMDVMMEKSNKNQGNPSAVNDILDKIKNIRDDGLGNNADKDNKPKLN